MRLSKRIYSICDAVHKGETVADIGTDHGYVPMLLMKNGISPYAIMSDISADSLSKAVETFRLCNIPAEPEQFRVFDGLDGIKAAEVDDVIIAGLGGFTIIGILDKDAGKSKSFKKIIMQPRKHSGNLRYYLYTHGYDIVEETLSPEGKFVCEIITAVPIAEAERLAPYPEDDIRWKYPEAFVGVDTQMLEKRLNWKLSSIDEEINNLSKSKNDNNKLIDKLKSDRKYLEDLLKRNIANDERS